MESSLTILGTALPMATASVKNYKPTFTKGHPFILIQRFVQLQVKKEEELKL